MTPCFFVRLQKLKIKNKNLSLVAVPARNRHCERSKAVTPTFYTIYFMLPFPLRLCVFARTKTPMARIYPYINQSNYPSFHSFQWPLFPRYCFFPFGQYFFFSAHIPPA